MVTLNGFISLTMQRERTTVLRLNTLPILSNSSKVFYESRFVKYSASFRLKYSEWGTVRLLHEIHLSVSLYKCKD